MGYTCAPSSSPTRKTIDVRLGMVRFTWTDESSNRRSMLYAPTTVRNYACVLISYHETPPCLPCQCERSFNYDCKSSGVRATFALAKLVPVALVDLLVDTVDMWIAIDHGKNCMQVSWTVHVIGLFVHFGAGGQCPSSSRRHIFIINKSPAVLQNCMYSSCRIFGYLVLV